MSTVGMISTSLLYRKPMERLYPPGGALALNDPIALFLLKRRYGVATVLLLLSIVTFLVNPVEWYHFGPILFAGAFFYAVDEDELQRRFNISLPRNFDLLWIFFIALAFGVGYSDGLKVIRGQDFVAVSFKDSGSVPYRYLGRAGDYMLVWNPESKETTLVRLEVAAPVVLTRVRGSEMRAAATISAESCSGGPWYHDCLL
jgi:hypothetical protein